MRKLAMLILIVLIFASCAPKSTSALQVDSSKSEHDFIEGKSPKDYDLRFEVPSSNPLGLSPTEAVLKEEGTVEFDVSYHFSTVSKVKEYPVKALTFVGCMQTIFVRLKNTSELSSAIDGATVLSFQLFDRDDFKDGAYVKLYDFEVPYAELKDNIIYKTKQFVAVDVTDYLLGIEDETPIPLEEHLSARWPNGNPDKEYALAVRDYYLENLASALQATNLE